MARFLVTGASRGIGRAVVERLASDGHELIAAGRDRDSLGRLPVAERVVLDLSRPETLAAALPRYEHLDGVVHSAGMVRIAPVAAATTAQWQAHLTLNVTAVAELTRLLLPGLRAAGGSVVMINSGAGRNANPGWGAYAASKFGLRALADSLRAEEPALRVTSVYPGRTATDMQRDLRAQEGGTYEPEQYIDPATLAAIVAGVLSTPKDAVITELIVRPRG